MFFRLLIIIVAGILIYRVVKSLLLMGQRNHGDGGHPQQVDDVMVKDPYCGTYFAKREGVTLQTTRKTLHFCSNECRDKYTAEQRKGQ